MDHQTAASTAAAPVKQSTVDFWRGMVWALVGTAAGGVTAFLAIALHQSIMVVSVIAAGIWLYRDRKLRRQGQIITSPM
jgi:hypothetical protein